jgi:hypothetical protein
MKETMFNPKSEKYLKAKESLPKELHAQFEFLVRDYSFYAFQAHGQKWVSYDVLAELVKVGWRLKEGV